MSKRDKKLLLEDMLEAAEKIMKYTHEMDFDSFINDEKTVDAVVRNFEIIGEAANRIDDSFKALHPEIAWSRMRGFRNRIVHDYFGIDYEIVWNIRQNDIRPLIKQLNSLIE